jgi:hypothetical protein
MCPSKVVWCFIVTSVSLLDFHKLSITMATAHTLAVIADAQTASAGIVLHVILANQDRFLAILHPTQPALAPAAQQELTQVSKLCIFESRCNVASSVPDMDVTADAGSTTCLQCDPGSSSLPGMRNYCNPVKTLPVPPPR